MYTIWTDGIKDPDEKKKVQETLKSSTTMRDQTMRIITRRLKELDVDNPNLAPDPYAVMQMVGERRAWLHVAKIFDSLKE